MKDIKYTWENLEEDTQYLTDMIYEDDWKPSTVVGLIRGGCPPGIMMSHKFGVPFEALCWSKRDFANQGFGHYIEHICKGAIQRNHRFLIVDDIIDSGETVGDLIYYASKFASIKYWSNYIRFASLWQNTDSPVKANYWAREISRKEDSRWIVFPWE